MLLALLAIWTNADYSWPKPLVLCRQPISAHGAFVCVVWLALELVRIRREMVRERYILRPPKFVRMRVRVRIRVHVTGGVLARGLTYVGRLSEQPHWRWPKQGAAVAKQGGLGELSGLCKVYRPKRRPAEGAVLFRSIMWLYSASVVLGSALHLALAIFQQGIPCFGHCPKNKTNASLLQEKKTGKSEERKTGPRKKNQEKLQV